MARRTRRKTTQTKEGKKVEAAGAESTPETDAATSAQPAPKRATQVDVSEVAAGIDDSSGQPVGEKSKTAGRRKRAPRRSTKKRKPARSAEAARPPSVPEEPAPAVGEVAEKPTSDASEPSAKPPSARTTTRSRGTGRRRSSKRAGGKTRRAGTDSAGREAAGLAAEEKPKTPEAGTIGVTPKREDASAVEADTAIAEAAASHKSPAEDAKGTRTTTRKAARRKRRKAISGASRTKQERDAKAPDRDAEVETFAEEAQGDVEIEVEEEAPIEPGAGRTMLINVSAGDECRIAVVHEHKLEELFIERTSLQSHVGNIYKGRVTNVEPSIQAVFVDFGLPKNGFLHISDVQPQYFPNHKGEPEDVGRKIPRHNRPPVQNCFRRGQEVIVQITKEGVGTKGPTLTTYLSIPGRFLVMMPGMSRHGVSRKIEDEAERRKMRELLGELKLPGGMGFILRTAGLGQTKRELQRDLNYLLRLWKTVVQRIKSQPAPAELYEESDLVTRTIRDVYTAEFDRIVTDDVEAARRAREFLQIAMPRSKAVVELYSQREPLFHRFKIEEEIEKINMRHVPLPSGGSLVIDSTEALVAIDVNSGRFRASEDAEETAFHTDMEAAEEIARQLRLRDLGGLIVCDFIDLRLDRHKRAVEKALRDALKEHKERARILRMSAFGLIEMTRQRQGPSIKRNIYFECEHCKGSGLVKMPESVALDVMRIIQLAAHHEKVQRVTVTIASEVAFQILNRKRAVLGQIEAETGKEVIIRGDASFTSDQIKYVCEDARGQAIPVGPAQDNAEPAAPNAPGARSRSSARPRRDHGRRRA